MHVLVVENDLDTRDLLRKVLIDAGYRVSPAKGPADALRLSWLYPDIDVVVVDTHYCHGHSGIDMANDIRRRLNDGHYILTSSDWDALMSPRPDDVSVLRKPYGKNELLRAVLRGVARRNERRRFSSPTESQRHHV